MAQVAPFRGLHYNLAKVPHLEDVVTPPYDVIRPPEREAFAARDPHNMVHLILPQALPGDDLLHHRYTRAAALFRQWQGEGVLVRDSQPAFYYWETEFQQGGRTRTRAGLVALVRLEPLTGGVIRPHEQTFSAAKADRLELLKYAQAHFSPIFSIFPDPTNGVLEQLRHGLSSKPLMAFKDSEGYLQRVFAVTAAGTLGAVFQALADLPLFIADGHHRYETSLAYQKFLRNRYPQASPRAAFNYALMYLSNMYDPDLVILMAHRLLGGPRLKQLEETWFLNRLNEYFEVATLPWSGGSGNSYGDALQQRLAAAAPQETAFILLGFGRKAWHLQLRPGVRQKVLARQMHPALAQLDVAVLNYLIFEKILSLDAKAQDDQGTCKYTSKISEAVTAVGRGEASLAFLLNPTRIEQVKEVATAGLIMPRKSTYFYPKVMTGLLLNPIYPEEEIVIPG